jgi:aspartate 1-decarboxylase
MSFGVTDGVIHLREKVEIQHQNNAARLTTGVILSLVQTAIECKR